MNDRTRGLPVVDGRPRQLSPQTPKIMQSWTAFQSWMVHDGMNCPGLDPHQGVLSWTGTQGGYGGICPRQQVELSRKDLEALDGRRRSSARKNHPLAGMPQCGTTNPHRRWNSKEGLARSESALTHRVFEGFRRAFQRNQPVYAQKHDFPSGYGTRAALVAIAIALALPSLGLTLALSNSSHPSPTPPIDAGSHDGGALGLYAPRRGFPVAHDLRARLALEDAFIGRSRGLS